jgi:hypothetical protein
VVVIRREVWEAGSRLHSSPTTAESYFASSVTVAKSPHLSFTESGFISQDPKNVLVEIPCPEEVSRSLGGTDSLSTKVVFGTKEEDDDSRSMVCPNFRRTLLLGLEQINSDILNGVFLPK